MNRINHRAFAATPSSILLALAFVSLGAVAGCSGSIKAEAPGLVPVSQIDEAGPTEGVVVLVRPSAIGEGYAFPISDESGNVLAHIGAESQVALHVPPGQRTLVMKVHGTSEVVHLDVAQGSTQFVMIALAGTRWELQPVDSSAAAAPTFQRELARTPKFRLDASASSRVQIASRAP